MATISRWVVSPTPDDWAEAMLEYDTYAEARDVAIEQQGCVTEITYEFDDSELIDDFRPPPCEVEDEDTDERHIVGYDEDGDPVFEMGPDEPAQVFAQDE